jgi:hypothetical protein
MLSQLALVHGEPRFRKAILQDVKDYELLTEEHSESNQMPLATSMRDFFAQKHYFIVVDRGYSTTKKSFCLDGILVIELVSNQQGAHLLHYVTDGQLTFRDDFIAILITAMEELFEHGIKWITCPMLNTLCKQKFFDCPNLTHDYLQAVGFHKDNVSNLWFVSHPSDRLPLATSSLPASFAYTSVEHLEVKFDLYRYLLPDILSLVWNYLVLPKGTCRVDRDISSHDEWTPDTIFTVRRFLGWQTTLRNAVYLVSFYEYPNAWHLTKLHAPRVQYVSPPFMDPSARLLLVGQ